MSERLGPNHPVVWIVGFVAAVLGILGYLRSTGGGTVSVSPPSTQTGLAQQTDTPTTIVRPFQTQTTNESTTSFVPSRVYLVEMTPVSTSADLHNSNAKLAGTSYGNSLVFSCDLFCNDSASLARAAYDLGKAFSTFSTSVGISDSAPNTSERANFSVFVDGDERFSQNVAFGRPVPVTINVAGALRLELVITTGLGTVSPAQAGADAAGGVTDAFPHAVWGDPILAR